jgi:nitroreductase
MEAFEAILSRRSIRKYLPTPVSEHDIHQLLDAAMNAPSSSNGQPWHFVVVSDRKLLDEIPRFHAYSGMLKEAPLAVVVCGDTSLEKTKGVWVQDCSAATQNLLLAARALGLGSVWLGVYPLEDWGCRTVLSRWRSLPSAIRRKANRRPTASIPSGSTATSGS